MKLSIVNSNQATTIKIVIEDNSKIDSETEIEFFHSGNIDIKDSVEFKKKLAELIENIEIEKLNLE